MTRYLEDGWIKSEYIFYKSILTQWSVGFTKPMINNEILAGWFPTLLSSEMGIMGSSPALGKQFSFHFYFIIGILQFTCNFLSADLYCF